MSNPNYFSLNSEAGENWPTKEVRRCFVPQPLCSMDISPKMYIPYNFMMSPEHWRKVAETNKLEFLLATRYCMEMDMSVVSDELIARVSYHTSLYVKFQSYLKKYATKEVSKIVAEFEKQSFSLRFKTSFAIHDLLFLNGYLKQLNVPEIILNARALAINGNNGIVINRDMFKKVFGKDYDNEMLKILASNGHIADSGKARTEW